MRVLLPGQRHDIAGDAWPRLKVRLRPQMLKITPMSAAIAVVWTSSCRPFRTIAAAAS